MNKIPVDDDGLNIPQLALRRNAQFRSAVRRARKLLDEKKGDGTVELVPAEKQPKAKIAVLFKSKCFSPDCFAGAEITAIRRWREGSVREADLVLIHMMYELHLAQTKMGDKIPEVLPSI